MTTETECALASSFLRSGRMLGNSSNCAALIAAAGALVAHTLAARAAFAFSVLAWPAACYLGLRVAVDANLFGELARDPNANAQALDEALRRWDLGVRRPGRNIGDRCKGAMRLWNRLIAAVAIQLAALVGGIVVEALSFR
jgi:hypothetical protein